MEIGDPPCPRAALHGRIQSLYSEVNEVALRVEQVRDEVGHNWKILFGSLGEAFLGVGAAQVDLRLRVTVHGVGEQARATPAQP